MIMINLLRTNLGIVLFSILHQNYHSSMASLDWI